MKLSAVVVGLSLVAGLVATSPAPALAASCPAPGGGALPALPDLDGEIVFSGRGWGHGTGMSQYGARGAAELGCTHDEILSTYYPNTAQGTRPNTEVRLSLNPASLKTTVTALTADVRWQVCDSTCNYAHVQPRFETWIARVRQDDATDTASLRIERFVNGSWELVQEHGEDVTVRVVMQSVGSDNLGPVVSMSDGRWSGQLARGVLEIDPITGGADTAHVTLLIAMEQYLYGLGEIPSSWPTESLRAQAVAARSYAYQRIDGRPASSSLVKACKCNMRATTEDQYYWGYGKEAERSGNTHWGARWTAAVRDTTTKIRTYDGKPIPAFYSSVHGGSSESYAFWGGGNERGYLAAVDDSAWEAAAKAPLSAWAMRTTRKELGATLGIGTVTDVDTPEPKGAQGRIGIPSAGYGGVIVHGTTGTWRGSGDQLRKALAVLGPDCGDRTAAGEVQRLCSTMFDVWMEADPRPVPPPSGAIRVSGDWNGDGIDTPGWFKDGKWGLHDRNAAGGGTTELSYGQAGDIPVVGDWDGDGVDTVGVVRGNLWVLRNEYRRGAEDIVMRYGEPSDTKVTGDWDGNGTDTLGIVRGNLWVLRNEYRRGANDIVMRYGEPSDTKVTGDWDGNGTDTLGIVRGNLWVLRSVYRRGAQDVVMRYGDAADMKVTGDWDGNGTDTLGVVRGDRWLLRNRYVANAQDLDFRY